MIHPKKVGHVVLKARDLGPIEKFYTEVLGFEVVMRLDRPRGVFFTLGEQHHDIAVLEMPADAEPVKDNQVGLHHVALQVDSLAELQECYRTLKAHNVRITSTISWSSMRMPSGFAIARTAAGNRVSCRLTRPARRDPRPRRRPSRHSV